MFVATNVDATAANTVFLCVSYSERDRNTLYDLAAYEDDMKACGDAIRREMAKGDAADMVTVEWLLDENRDLNEGAELIRWAHRHGRCGYSVNSHGCAMYGCKH
jgi:hypothetical protein